MKKLKSGMVAMTKHEHDVVEGFTCPNCKRKLTSPHQVHNCMRIKRSDSGKRHVTQMAWPVADPNAPTRTRITRPRAALKGGAK